MPSKYYQRNFQPGHFYHIINRGSHKQNVFSDKQDYQAFIKILSYYLNDPTGKPLHYTKRTKYVVPNHVQTVYLITYCLMSNHFHLLLKQISPISQDGITNLMRRVSITYSMYFNNKYNHSGNLFQGKYKNVHIETDEQLLYLSKYIHLNPINKIRGSEPLQKYKHSSYPAFIDQAPISNWLHTEEILELDYYKNSKNLQKDYKNFVLDSKPLSKSISQLTLE